MAVDEMRVMRLAERRRRIVSGAELTEAGMSTSAIRHWVARNQLTRLHRGVYLVGPGPLDAEQSEIAAVLACGPGSVLAHAWSARRWGMPVAPKETNELLHGYEVDAL
jgi:predicted transcriptional regulator of viral defense system